MEKFGRYQVVKWLGGGGMADVYVAEDPRLGRQVAIKVIRARLPKKQESEFRRRFYREAQVMARLSHRAIVPIHDFGEEDGRPFIVMRLMKGGSLGERLQDKGTFSLAEAVSLLERLAPALDLAHQQDLVHRDLKPDNILLDRDQNPYIADFGIVKLLTATVPSKTGSIGTAKYSEWGKQRIGRWGGSTANGEKNEWGGGEAVQPMGKAANEAVGRQYSEWGKERIGQWGGRNWVGEEEEGLALKRVSVNCEKRTERLQKFISDTN